MIIDTHAHYDNFRFNKCRTELLNTLSENNIKKILNPATSFESNFAMRKVLSEYPQIFWAAGIHPVNAVSAKNEYLKDLYSFAEDKRTKAIGETGLDFFRVKSEEARQIQTEWFKKHIKLALETNLPLVLHIRQADAEAIKILKMFNNCFSGSVHCFCGDTKTASEYIDLGLAIGIGGAVTYENLPWLKETVSQIPKDSLLIETDSPFVKPVGYSEKLNSSLSLIHIADIIGNLRNITAQTVIDISNTNAERIFNL